MSPQIEIQLIAVVVAIACAIPGVFLVLRKMSMMTDAITHTILLGIIVAFFIVNDLNSPFLIIGAAMVGLVTVYLVSLVEKTGLVSEDSAIGIVFPLLFSIAIILISRYADDVHIDVDTVLLGELAFAPFNRLVVAGIDIGPKALYSMGAIMVVNIALAVIFFKEIKISIFDKALAAVLGFAPVVIHYGLMTIVSVTTVGAFEAVGSILVIAFMIGPPITAYLITDDLKKMLLLSSIIGVINALIGYRIAVYYDVSIAGSMATMTGISFFIIFLLSPERGFVSTLRRRRLQKWDFAKKSLLFHLLNHQGSDREKIENGIATIYSHLNWPKEYINKIIQELIREGKVVKSNEIYTLTDIGKRYTINSYEEIVASLSE